MVGILIKSFHNTKLLFILILAAFIFLRFYEIPQHTMLGWDQTDSAWAAKSILFDNPFRFEGVPIKGNTSMFMGPLYYYLITPFYYFTQLDMIASLIFASSISVINFIIFLVITRKLFDTHTTCIAAFLYTFSFKVIETDRVQAAFTLIPIISYAVFYFLYKIVTGNEKYILYLAGLIGFGFHIHFITLFYIPIVLLTSPLFLKTKKALFYSLYSLPIFFFSRLR